MIILLVAVVIGAILAVLLIGVGVVIGYLIGSKRLTEVAEQIETKVRVAVEKDEGGPVKAITRQEIEDEKKKGFAEKMQGIIEQ